MDIYRNYLYRIDLELQNTPSNDGKVKLLTDRIAEFKSKNKGSYADWAIRVLENMRELFMYRLEWQAYFESLRKPLIYKELSNGAIKCTRCGRFVSKYNPIQHECLNR